MKYPNNALLFISLFLLLAQQLAQSAATEAASVLAAFAEHEIVTASVRGSVVIVRIDQLLIGEKQKQALGQWDWHGIV